MKRAPTAPRAIRAHTALRAIGGFGVGVAVLSVTATAAVVVLAPEPVAPRMTAVEAIAALKGEETALERRYDEPPEGPRAQLLESVIAAELGSRPADVRVVWPDQAPDDRASVAFRIVSLDLAKAAGSGPVVMRGEPDGTFRIVPAAETDRAIRSSIANLPNPAFSASVRQSDGRWLTVAQPRPFLNGWQRNVLIALAISLLLLAPFAWLFARRLTRPFRELAGALDDTSSPIPQEGPRELREAAGAIAAMRAKLTSEAVERARILTAIAHDLRTPLTSLRLRTEAVAEPRRTRMVDDIERMQAMIDEVLGFARDAAVPVEHVEVRAFVREIVAGMGEPARSIVLLPGANAQVAVPPLAFRRVIENLVRNAVDYAQGGEIAIGCEDNHMLLCVADRGPGIFAEDCARLLQPFERGEASRSRETGGTGLGLSIVRDFAARYRGSFLLRNAPEGGVLAELRLPLVKT